MKYINLLIAMGLFCAGNTQAQNTKNSLLFYRLEKNGSYTLISDTAGKYANETDLKSSKEENVEIYYRYRGEDFAKAVYSGEMVKLKLEVGKVQLPHGLGVLLSEKLSYNGQWSKGEMMGKGDWVFNNEKYNGNFSNNSFEGDGAYTYEDGNLYVGQWSKNKRNGEGTYYFTYLKTEFNICEYGSLKATKLKVTWKNDTASGPGELTYLKENNEEAVLTGKNDEPINWKGFNLTGNIIRVDFTNGNQYEGGIKDGKLSGKGRLKYKVAGTEELGQKNGVWENGVFTGRATIPYEAKMSYRGEIVKDIREGFGEMNYNDGSTYNGQWVNGHRAGKGKYIWPNGNNYEGEWKNNQITGFGTMVLKGYSTWKCNWNDGIPADSGEVVYSSGATYRGGVSGRLNGNTINYFYHGFGRFNQSFPTSDTSFRNDSFYVGYYKEGKFHGKGEYNRINSGQMFFESYSGDWINGEKHGTGKYEYYVYSNGGVYSGEWKNNKKNGSGVLSNS